MDTEFRDLDDELARRFAELLLASGLVPPLGLSGLLREFSAEHPDRSLRTADNLSAFVVMRKAVTAWQVEKLREGRYKGFFLDNYVIVDRVRIEESGTIYLALDTTTKRRAFLRVFRSRREPGRPIRYDVVEVESSDSQGDVNEED